MSSTTPKGPDASVWPRRGDDSTRSWAKEKEAGAALRGISRNRGRGGGAGRARGGRAAGGRSVSARAVADLKPTILPPLPEKPGAVGGAGANNSEQPKGHDIAKSSNRPNLTAQGPASQSSESLSSLSPNKTNTRRRRNTHKRSASTAATMPKPLPIITADGLPSSPSAPLAPFSKDTPLHTVSAANPDAPVHDLCQEITSLVDHVRSMAMDGNRPSSPSTRIDWAGDDDDSLPDLDDWGVSSKLASEVGDPSKNVATIAASLTALPSSTDPTPASEAVDETNTVPSVVDGAPSSAAESPTESSMSLSVPPPVKRERERRRERGSRRDKERRTLQVNKVNGAQAPLPGTRKKSLLERLSSPVRPEPAETAEEAPVSGIEQPVIAIKPVSTVNSHPALPPKPPIVLKKAPSTARGRGAWRNNHSENTRPMVNNQVAPKSVSTVEAPAPTQVSASVQEKSTTPPAVVNEEVKTASKDSRFDWSEEPVTFDTPYEPPKAPSVTVEPTPPLDNSTSQAPPSTISPPPAPNGPHERLDAGPSPRLRSQRPLSGDVTPRPHRERSPYKAHNPRNHSVPNASVAAVPPARTRPQLKTRPIIKMEALAMISRTLRDEPAQRRESPPATKAVE